MLSSDSAARIALGTSVRLVLRRSSLVFWRTRHIRFSNHNISGNAMVPSILWKRIPHHTLTAVAHEPSIVIEQATSSYSFRFPELSQPI